MTQSVAATFPVLCTAPHVLTPNHNITSLLLHNCNVTTVNQCKYLICRASDNATPMKELFDPNECGPTS